MILLAFLLLAMILFALLQLTLVALFLLACWAFPRSPGAANGPPNRDIWGAAGELPARFPNKNIWG